MHLSRRSPAQQAMQAVIRWAVPLALLPVVAACAAPRPAAQPTPAPTPAALAARSPNPAVVASPSALAGAGLAIINMTDALKFEPATLTVAKGTRVTWRNSSQTVHTVTDDPAKASNKADAVLPSGAQPWDSGNLNPGQAFSHTFDTPGTYKYFCTPHEMAGMTATIIVTG